MACFVRRELQGTKPVCTRFLSPTQHAHVVAATFGSTPSMTKRAWPRSSLQSHAFDGMMVLMVIAVGSSKAAINQCDKPFLSFPYKYMYHNRLLNHPSLHNQNVTKTAPGTTRTDRLDNQETKIITKLLASAAWASLAIGQLRVFC